MNTRPLRILQVVGGMNRGGVETWMMHILRNLDRDRYRLDFLVHTTSPCAYDEEARRLGAAIVPCLHPSRPHVYARNFRRLLRAHGPYDVVHSHVHHFSGFVLRLAWREGVRVRIAHSHSDTSRIQAEASPIRAMYLSLTKHWIRRYATHGLAVSREAAAALFGAAWRKEARYRLLFCGIDLAPFQAKVDPMAVRDDLAVPRDAFVIGHVGRFVSVKNHAFLIEIVAELVKTVPHVHLLLIGDGELLPAIEQQAARAGLARRVTFAGGRSEVPRLMRAMDVFAFPSHFEGLPLALAEAQAAGVPCIASDAITEEVNLIPQLIQRLSLAQSASVWAEAIKAMRATATDHFRADAWRKLERSRLDIRTSVEELENCYRVSTELARN